MGRFHYHDDGTGHSHDDADHEHQHDHDHGEHDHHDHEQANGHGGVGDHSGYQTGGLRVEVLEKILGEKRPHGRGQSQRLP